MNAAVKILKYELRDLARSKWVLGYALFFFVLAEMLLRFGGGSTPALLSLMNVVLLVVPLASVVFGTMYLYNARDFVELLLAQPVPRRQLFYGLYSGLSLPLAIAYLAGVTLPFVLRGVEPGQASTLLALALVGAALTGIFVAFAFLIAVRFEDRVKGLATALVIWLFATVVYDGLVLLIITAFASYPLETPTLVLSLLNPVDLARVALLMQFDIAALMGYTGAVFEAFFGSAQGRVIAAATLLLWAALPLALGLRVFQRKDF